MTIFQKGKDSQLSKKNQLALNEDVDESGENYLDHPMFGLLYSVCPLQDSRELFTTLYAMRLFFLVTASGTNLKFDSIGRHDARLLVEDRLRYFRSNGRSKEYDKLFAMYKQTF